MGGEKHLSGTTDNRPQGSPPRGRGKEVGYIPFVAFLRITPAWAGKSISQTSTMKPAEDHPRVGGEKTTLFRLFFGYTGSPPRGRGKAFSGSMLSKLPGITPAWAGKSID